MNCYGSAVQSSGTKVDHEGIEPSGSGFQALRRTPVVARSTEPLRLDSWQASRLRGSARSVASVLLVDAPFAHGCLNRHDRSRSVEQRANLIW